VIPTTLDDVHAAWLAELLAEPVDEIAVTPIARGEGFMGQLARVSVQYGEGASPAAPATVVVKLPTTEPGNRLVGELLRLWDREHRFYAEVAPRLDVRVPVVHANVADADHGAYALILEDLAPMTATDQVHGATPDQARRVVDELVALHAPWWASPELDELDWMPDLHDPMVNAVVTMFDAGWDGFCARYRSRLPERVFGWAERFVRRVPDWLAGYAEEPATIVHGDARLDNMLFGTDGAFAMVDWQMAMRSPGTADLIYFVATNLTPAMRRQLEQELLERYRQQALANGAKGRVLTEEGILRSYREGVLFWCVSMASSLLTLDAANERGAALLDALVQRLFVAADDLDCGQVVP
jgi:aminoglycoside phosphotransferase (APT) family kinase protein